MVADHPANPHNAARVATAISALFGLILAGMVGFHSLEGWNWSKSFYFTVSTLTTVGYGDLHPTSDASRIFTGIFILVGVGVSITALGIIGASYLEQRTQRIVRNGRK